MFNRGYHKDKTWSSRVRPKLRLSLG